MVMSFVVLVLVVLSVLPHASAENFTRFYLNQVDPKALCNDGSPAAYYFRPGKNIFFHFQCFYLQSEDANFLILSFAY